MTDDKQRKWNLDAFALSASAHDAGITDLAACAVFIGLGIAHARKSGAVLGNVLDLVKECWPKVRP